MTNKVVSTKGSAKSSVKHAMKKDMTGIPALLEVVKFLVGAYNALRSINCQFDNREKEGIEKVRRYGINQARIQFDGGRPDPDSVARTIRLATHVATDLDKRFEGIMRDSFTIFEKQIREVERTIPDIRARDGNKIAELQQALRDVLAKPDADYDETIDAYNAMMGYLPAVSQKAKEIIEAERERQRVEKRQAISMALIEELEGLELD